MKTKLIVGSIIAIALLLLMPSIPAIQQKTIEDKAYSDLVERIEDFNFKDLKEITSLEKDEKFPKLWDLIKAICSFRSIRGATLEFIADIFMVFFQLSGPIVRLIYLRGTYLFYSADYFLGFCLLISFILGWGWDRKVNNY